MSSSRFRKIKPESTDGQGEGLLSVGQGYRVLPRVVGLAWAAGSDRFSMAFLLLVVDGGAGVRSERAEAVGRGLRHKAVPTPAARATGWEGVSVCAGRGR